jgi:hypothetical protein
MTEIEKKIINVYDHRHDDIYIDSGGDLTLLLANKPQII